MRTIKLLLFLVMIFFCGNINIVKADESSLLLLEYKKKAISYLQNTYDSLDIMYNQRFVDMTIGQDATINKTPVYYDAVKGLWELQELTHDRTGLTAEEIALLDQIPGYIEKSKKIIAQRYIQSLVGGGGYQAFPHGLGYLYQSTGDTEALAGLVDLRNEGNWVTGFNPNREDIVYTRDSAYSLQVGITAKKLGINITAGMSEGELMNNYLEVVLSHLDQWHTGNFLDFGYTPSKYRSSFMTGLTMNALIEYYERINPDPRIPVAVKNVLDDLWVTVWHPDVTNPSPQTLGDAQSYVTMNPGGAFWTWADWVDGQYVIDRDHNPSSIDVGAIHNSIIGQAYAWYATISNDEAYNNKAVDIFNGAVANLPIGNGEGQFFEGIRYGNDLIKWHRKFYNTPCSNSAIEQCITQSACEIAGGNWTGEWCQHAPVAVMSVIDDTSPSAPSGLNVL